MRASFFRIPVFFYIFLFSFNTFGQSSVWLSNSYYLRKHYTQVRHFEQYLFADQIIDDEETDQFVDLRTHTALIVKDNQIIYEKYSKGHDQYRPQKLLSISKSITNLLIGIAVKENKISLQDNLCKYFKDFEFRLDCSKITIENLLGWSSGIHWREIFDAPFSSSIFNLLYTKTGYKDSTSFILNHPLIKKPGTSWHYSSADTNLLMAVLSKVYHPNEYVSLPWTKLFNELGIQSAFWDKDHKEVFNGCCSLYLTARDLARIGVFMLKKGQWMGRQYLPNNWIPKYVKRISPSFLKEPILIKEQFVPGFHWWVNLPSQHGKIYKPRALINAPNDLFLAIGFGGQYLIIIPSMNMIFVRTGQPSSAYLDVNALVGMAISIVNGKDYNLPIQKQPLPFSIGQEYSPPQEYKPSVSQTLNNFVAKEMCNCIFIEKGSKEHCTENLFTYIKPFQNISVSRKQKHVKVSMLKIFQLSQASFNDRYGCRLL